MIEETGRSQGPSSPPAEGESTAPDQPEREPASAEEIAREIEQDPAYNPEDDELREVKGG